MTSGIHQIIDRQIKRWELEAQSRAAAATEPEPAGPPVIHPWITVSRALGAGGSAIARAVAGRLDYQVYDRELLELLVREHHLHHRVLELLDERSRSSLEIWVQGIVRGRLVDKGDYLRTLASVLTSVALHGRAVIIGRGANFVLDASRGLHVRVTAPFDLRVGSVAAREGIGREEAERAVHRSDQERAAFIQGYFHHGIDDPLGYDLVINTAALGIEPASELIERTLRAKLSGKAGFAL